MCVAKPLPHRWQGGHPTGLFQPQGSLYHRSTERFTERAYPVEEVLAMLRNAGFEEVQVFDELTFNPPRKDSQRLVFAAKKQGRNESV